MTGIVVDMSAYFARKQWLNARHEQAWKLHEKYADRYSNSKKQFDLQMAQKWMDIAMGFGWDLDEMEFQVAQYRAQQKQARA